MASSTPLTNIGGLASGLDTNTIITQLLALKKQPVVKLGQQLAVSQSRQSGMQEISNLLSSVRSSAQALRSDALWNQQQGVAVSDASVLSATSTATTAPGGYAFQVLTLARAEQQRSVSGFSGALADDVLHIQVGSGAVKNVAITAGASLEDIAGKINDSSGVGVYASVVSGRLYLSGKSTGAANTLTISSDATLAADLGLSVTSAAQDASYRVDGGAIQNSASNTVTDAVAGLSLTFKQAGSSTVSVSQAGSSGEAVADKLSALVDALNAALKGSRQRLTTKPLLNPTSDSERAVGSLFNDSGLQLVVGQLRGFANRVSSADPVGATSTLASLGITTQAAGAAVGAANDGQLTFNRQKFLELFAASPEAVRAQLDSFTANESSEGLSQWVERQIDRLVNSGGTVAAAISGQQDQQKALRDRQTRITDSLSRYETQLRRQYTTLETSLGKLQAQQARLSQQLSSM